MKNVKLKNNLLKLFYEANQNFLINHMIIIERDLAERNLCQNLALEISFLKNQYQFSEYFADCEYDKNGLFRKQILDDTDSVHSIICDLIFHSRGRNQKDNLIALEMKKLPSTKELLEKDRMRLKALTKQEYEESFDFNGFRFPTYVCGYEIGIYYLIDIPRNEITLEIYEDGRLVNTEKHSFEYYMQYIFLN